GSKDAAGRPPVFSFGSPDLLESLNRLAYNRFSSVAERGCTTQCQPQTFARARWRSTGLFIELRPAAWRYTTEAMVRPRKPALTPGGAGLFASVMPTTVPVHTTGRAARLTFPAWPSREPLGICRSPGVFSTPAARLDTRESPSLPRWHASQ